MSYFEWAEDMAIDHGPIDRNHKKLIAHVNLLHTATTEGNGQEVVGELLKELLNEMRGHIRQEEQYIESLGYPGLEEHKTKHTQFITALNGLQTRHIAGSTTVASKLSTLLRDWLSVHIQRYDKDLLNFTQNKEREKRRAAGAVRNASR